MNQLENMRANKFLFYGTLNMTLTRMIFNRSTCPSKLQSKKQKVIVSTDSLESSWDAKNA